MVFYIRYLVFSNSVIGIDILFGLNSRPYIRPLKAYISPVIFLEIASSESHRITLIDTACITTQSNLPCCTCESYEPGLTLLSPGILAHRFASAFVAFSKLSPPTEPPSAEAFTVRRLPTDVTFEIIANIAKMTS